VGFRARIRSFLKWWVTPLQYSSPEDKPLPSQAIPVAIASIVILVLDWLYFSFFVPYDSIPNKPIFWASFAIWGIGPTLFFWIYRNVPASRATRASGNMFVGIALVALVLLGLSYNASELDPVVFAFMPGVLTGGLIGNDTVLIWGRLKGRK
jgi:hypothetical protein